MGYGAYQAEQERDVGPVERLILELGRLPGIGERSAARLAFYLLKQARDSGVEASLAFDLSKALVEVVEQVGLCSDCFNLSSTEKCPICTDTRRDDALLCVVETVADLRAIESTGSFRGLFHVLHGVLAPLDGVGPEDLKLDALVERVATGGFEEVILGMNADVEGDATALYLARILGSTRARVSRLASGIPMGGELEYLDHATLGRALLERREFS
jgi:recombination protein RecR